MQPIEITGPESPANAQEYDAKDCDMSECDGGGQTIKGDGVYMALACKYAWVARETFTIGSSAHAAIKYGDSKLHRHTPMNLFCLIGVLKLINYY